MLLGLGDKLTREGKMSKVDVYKAVFALVIEDFMPASVGSILLHTRDKWKMKVATAAGADVTVKKLVDAETVM